MASEHRNVPRHSLRSTAVCRFEAKSDPDSLDNVPVTILARTGEPIEHWYWGRIVHDLDGMRRKGTVPIDWCHDYSEDLGYLDGFTVTRQGLECTGELVPYEVGDRVDRIVHKASRGIPYEASIDWSGGSMRLEEVGEGQSAKVNGHQVDGPAVVVREWSLTAVAICPHGADAGTETMFADDDDRLITVEISRQEAAMPRKPKLFSQTDPPPEEPVAEPVPEEQPPAEPAPEEQPAEPVAEQAEATFTASQVQAYMTEFGQDGWRYLTSGWSREQALADQLAKAREASAQLTAQLTAKDEEIKRLTEQVAAAQKLTHVEDAVSGRPEATHSPNRRPGGIVPLRQ